MVDKSDIVENAAMSSTTVMLPTISAYMNHRAEHQAEKVWLKDRKGDVFTTWTWAQAKQESDAFAAWLESRYPGGQTKIGILSKNRAHWMLADVGVCNSGNVSVPMFTTMIGETAEYLMNFTETQLLILGEAANWAEVEKVLPDYTQILTLPGVELDREHVRWEDIQKDYLGQSPSYVSQADDLITLPFTSGTTGVPKGVMQNHDSMLIPMQRAGSAMEIKEDPRFLSYLPLAHIAERQLIWIQSLIHCAEVSFNEDLSTLARDMAATMPTYFFGAPRVWEQLHQGILAKLGGQEALDAALEKDREGTQEFLKAALGLQHADYLLTAAAPTPPPLIHWYESIGLTLLEGYGQSEAMGVCANTAEEKKIGSIGRPVDGVEMKIGPDDELLVRCTGLAPGYYKRPEKTAETFVDGWVHTGDKAKVDDDGFFYITGRVKDYFKTIQGKFVAPPPIEGAFAEAVEVEQLCLLGRGYSKTVMVVVLSELAGKLEKTQLETLLLQQLSDVNKDLEKHARLGAVIVAAEPWTIENGFLTPTLKLKRDQVEGLFGEQAERLARESAEQGKALIEWR